MQDVTPIECEGGLYLDGDMLSFKVASAVEKTSVIVKYKPTGSTKKFKNRTEFKGRSTKELGGWIGEMNKSRVQQELEPWTLDMFDVDDAYENPPLEDCVKSIKYSIRQYTRYLKCDKLHIVVGKGDTFRHKLSLPKIYKWNRIGLHRPLHLTDVKQYLVDEFGAELVTGIESDDRLSMYQYAGHVNFLKHGSHHTTTIQEDKDALGTDGSVFIPQTGNDGFYVEPKPIIVNGIGELTYDLIKKKVKGKGRAWLYFQIANGDDTDGYNSTKYFFKGVGEKTVYDAFENCSTDKEYLTAMNDMYHDWFPSGLQYKSWDGKDMDLKPIEWMQMMATCAYMHRCENDSISMKKMMDFHGITYD